MSTRTVTSLSVIFGLLLLSGCATSSEPVEEMYDDTANRTIYRTSKIRLSDIQMTAGIQKQNRFYMRVVGRCSGQKCTPSEYSIHFIKQGTQSVTLGGRDISLTIGTETITWDDPQTRDVNQTTTIRSGIFAKIQVSSGQLSTIGAVSEVTGSVGGTGFEIPYENRSPIRALMSQLEGRKEAASRSSS